MSNCISIVGYNALCVARSEIGIGKEEGGNNRGQHVARYCRGREGVNWCAGFVYYCINKAHEMIGAKNAIEFSLGAKRLAKNIVKAGGYRVDIPMRGDVAVFHRGRKVKGIRGWIWSWKGHICMVDRYRKVDGERYLDSIDGNSGPFPAPVRTITRKLDRRFYGFFRIPLPQ